MLILDKWVWSYVRRLKPENVGLSTWIYSKTREFVSQTIHCNAILESHLSDPG